MTNVRKALFIDTGVANSESVLETLRSEQIPFDAAGDVTVSHNDYAVVVGMLPAVGEHTAQSARAISFARHVSQLHEHTGGAVYVTADIWLRRMSAIMRGDSDKANMANEFAKLHSQSFLAQLPTPSTEDYDEVFGSTPKSSAIHFPSHLRLDLLLAQPLRYGENPHQSAALYTTTERRFGVVGAKQVQGKQLSYNNINDTDAAIELVAEFDPTASAAVAIIKHANPCGVAVGASLVDAYKRALECDPVSAFGGIVALNRKLDRAAAEAIAEIFTEVVVAPDADDDAKAVFARKKNLRLLVTGGLPNPAARGLSIKSIAGGFLVQDRDVGRVGPEQLRIVTKQQPTDDQVRDMLFAFTVCKHVKSNAIVYAKNGQTAGIGAGQMNRRDSARIAALRAGEAAETAKLPASLAQGSACASDAFFPFPDGLLQAVEAGATSVIQPGGSIRDEDVIKAADEAGVAMAFTDMRHFRH